MCLLLVVYATSIVAQDYVSIDNVEQIMYYDYIFCETAGNKESVKRRLMLLEIGKNRSLFCSEKEAYSDSLLMVHGGASPQATLDIIMPQIKGLQGHDYIDYHVYKNYPQNGNIFFVGSLFGERYVVNEEINFKWEIQANRDTTILDLSCLMATTSYGGRDYVAWFAPDVPISDGPYKFCGLPGLIVRIADTENEHIFELQGARYNVSKPLLFNNNYNNDPKLSPPKYVKSFYESIANRASEMEAMLIEPNPELIAKIAGRYKRYNNFIERY